MSSSPDATSIEKHHFISIQRPKKYIGGDELTPTLTLGSGQSPKLIHENKKSMTMTKSRD
jgi:hypothetical protein